MTAREHVRVLPCGAVVGVRMICRHDDPAWLAAVAQVDAYADALGGAT